MKRKAPKKQRAAEKGREARHKAQSWRECRVAESGTSPTGSAGASEKKNRLPVLIVLAICALYAAQLGIHKQDFRYQSAPAEIVLENGCAASESGPVAFAFENTVVLPLPHLPNYTVYANLRGSGPVKTAALSSDDATVNATGLWLGGQLVCAPCELGKEYAVDFQDGAEAPMLVALRAGSRELSASDFSDAKLAFFNRQARTMAIAPLSITLGGGWKAEENRAMPSSFYRVDAPFHIWRGEELAGYLVRGKWPWSMYSHLSALPGALLGIATGGAWQYAYKAYSIALFFTPLALFYLFSRKLSAGKDAAFLFASFAYLFIPTAGYPSGGPELFFYGMTANVFATYLAFFFFFFGYEFAVEGRRGWAAAAAAVCFGLGAYANLRLLFTLGIMLFALLLAMAHRGRFATAAVFAVACAASAAWFAVPFFHGYDPTWPGGLGGVTISGANGSVFELALQNGAAIVPALFLAGIWQTARRREPLPAILAACAIVILFFATNEQVNRAFPSFDGLRHLPSVFLAAYFIAGVGGAWIWNGMVGKAREWGCAAKLDSTSAAGCFALAILLPAAAVFFVFAQSAMGQYAAQGVSAGVLVDYASQEKAAMAIGGARFAFVPSGSVSQYPIAQGLAGTWRKDTGFESAESLAGMMRKENLRYALFGNLKLVGNESEKPRWQEYREVSESGLFARLPSYDYAPLFELKGAWPASGEGRNVDWSLAEYPSKYGYELPLAFACAAVLVAALAALARLAPKQP